jgi:hypothetical protein
MGRNEMFAEAQNKGTLAMKAHEAGDTVLRDAYLQQAADRYEAAGYEGLALWCRSFGRPAITEECA